MTPAVKYEFLFHTFGEFYEADVAPFFIRSLTICYHRLQGSVPPISQLGTTRLFSLSMSDLQKWTQLMMNNKSRNRNFPPKFLMRMASLVNEYLCYNVTMSLN